MPSSAERTSSAPRRQFDILVRTLAERYGDDAREMAPAHWAFEVETGGGRSHVVHLFLHEHASDALDASRLIASAPVGPVPTKLDCEGLLRRNARLDVGAICVEDLRTDDGPAPFLTLRATHLLVTAEFEEAWELVEQVARVADALEKDLFVHDVF